jgi:hypothetical protein
MLLEIKSLAQQSDAERPRYMLMASEVVLATLVQNKPKTGVFKRVIAAIPA